MKKVAILGSGFGLYGYLPAMLRGCGQRVILPVRYGDRLRSRPDVADLERYIEWVGSEGAAIETADVVIIAMRPADQPHWVSECLSRPNITHMLLEKPLAPSPESSAKLLAQLQASGKIVRLGYTFRYTDWGQALLGRLRNSWHQKSLSIAWQFKAHHYEHNLDTWKRKVAEGGGAIRFYGIQLIALLAEIGYNTVAHSGVSIKPDGEAELWKATFEGSSLPSCRIAVDSNAPNASFTVCLSMSGNEAGYVINSVGPFSQSNQDRGDPRVDILKLLCAELLEGDEPMHPWYQHAIDLWTKAEFGLNRGAAIGGRR